MTHDSKSLADEHLMQLYQQGEIAAFDELYRRHAPKAYGFLLPRSASRQIADDLLQSCFLKLHQSRHQYDPHQPFLPWFWTILRSGFTDSLRRDFRNPARANVSEEDSRLKWESIAAIEPESSAGSGATSAVLEQLTPDQRRLIELRTQQELSFEQIATELKITPATARQRFSRLIRGLQAQLSRKGRNHE